MSGIKIVLVIIKFLLILGMVVSGIFAVIAKNTDQWTTFPLSCGWIINVPAAIFVGTGFLYLLFWWLAPLVNAPHIKLFNNATEVDDYLIKKTKKAKNIIRDFTWQDSPSGTVGEGDRAEREKKYHKAISNFSMKHTYQEIFTFPKTEKAHRRIVKLMLRKSNALPRYECRYIPEGKIIMTEHLTSDIGKVVKKCHIPRIQCTIIDGEETIFASANYKLLAVKNKELAELFMKYFDRVWDIATPIKELSTTWDENVLKTILSEYDSTAVKSVSEIASGRTTGRQVGGDRLKEVVMTTMQKFLSRNRS